MLLSFDANASGAWHINFHDAHSWFVHLNRCQPVSSCHAFFRIAISPLNRHTNSLHRDFYFPGNGAFSATSKTRYNDKNFAFGWFYFPCFQFCYALTSIRDYSLVILTLLVEF